METVRPTEAAYKLNDEFYRYSARRDLGLPPTRERVLAHRCGDCGQAICPDGYHGMRCRNNNRLKTPRHDSVELRLSNTIRDGIGLAYRQQHGLPDADRTIPDLVIHLDAKLFLCDVVVSDTLAKINLPCSKRGPGCLAEKRAHEKLSKYSDCAAAMGATHLPFAVETIGGLSESAQQLLRELHHSVSTGGT